MSLRPGDAFAFEFQVNGADGALTDADALPTGTVVQNGTDDATPTVTITNKATGRYRASGTVPGGYAAGDILQVRLAATVGGVATGGVHALGVLDSARVGEVYTRFTQQIADEGVVTTGAAAGATSLTLPTGLTITPGTLLLFQGAARAAAYVEDYTTGTGATTLRAPGLSAVVADGEDFVAYQTADVPALDRGSDDRLLISADAHTAGATVAAVTDRTGYALTAGERTAIGTAVWATTTRTLSSFGTLVTDIVSGVWAAASRTLTAIGDSAGVTTLLSRLTSTRATALDNLDAAVSSRLAGASYAAAPTALQNAAAVRTELTTELARIDAAMTTRAAAGEAMTLTPGERDTLSAAILAATEDTDGVSLQGLIRLLVAFVAGPVTGADGDAATISFRNPSGDIVRLSMTVDANGNRAAAGALDLS